VASRQSARREHFDELEDDTGREEKDRAKRLDGTYLLKTDREDLTEDEIGRTCMLLTRVESAFRSMHGPLSERPIFHHLEHRVQTHIFLCVLAYHLTRCDRRPANTKRFLNASAEVGLASGSALC